MVEFFSSYPQFMEWVWLEKFYATCVFVFEFILFAGVLMFLLHVRKVNEKVFKLVPIKKYKEGLTYYEKKNILDPNWLAIRRAQKNLSFKELSRRTGISPTYLCAIENGKKDLVNEVKIWKLIEVLS